MMMPNDKTSSERPIGFWIKAADRALDATIDAAHRHAGVGRRGWQVLNAVAQAGGTIKSKALAGIFHPMLSVSETELQVDTLTQAGMLIRVGDAVELTGQGRETQKHVASAQELVRRKAMQGIDEAEYVTTLTVLKRLVTNLES